MVIGPFEFLMGLFVTSFGDYLWNVVPMGFWTANESGNSAWQGAWTIFYWGWWISWAPFVGMFIARISRGRTIREFMVGVMFVPTTIAFFWICMLGGNAIWQELNSVDGAGIVDTVRAWNLPNALYGTIDNLGTTSWMGDVSWIVWPLSALATLLLASWFITSSDSGTLVITTMLSMGDDNPPKTFRIIWGMGEGLVAAVLLIAGGLKALQTASIAAAFPISFVLLAMLWGLLKSLREDPSALPAPEDAYAPNGTRVTQEPETG
jgi:choline/glycine/proline betaine transport protein